MGDDIPGEPFSEPRALTFSGFKDPKAAKYGRFGEARHRADREY